MYLPRVYDSSVVNNFFLSDEHHVNIFFLLISQRRVHSLRVKKKEEEEEDMTIERSCLTAKVQSSNVSPCYITLQHIALLSLLFVSLCEGCGLKTHPDLHSLTFCSNSQVIRVEFNGHLRLSQRT